MEYAHFHDSYELHFTVSYNLKFIINNAVFLVPKGSVFAINPFVPHMTVVPDGAWFERYTVHIKPELLEEINSVSGIDLGDIFRTDSSSTASHYTLCEKEIIAFEQMLAREIERLQDNRFGADAFRKLGLAELLIFLLRVRHESAQRKVPIQDENCRLAKQIMDYILSNLTMDLNLDLLARKFYMNKYSISRIFKEYCGTTLSQYIITRRIYHACELLKDNLPVFLVCEQSGFSNYSHFIRTFKKHIGISPKQFALQLKSQSWSSDHLALK